MKAAMARHSSGVVRISVTLALWRWKRRSEKRAGMVSGAQKFTMSSAPGAPTQGMPVRTMAPRRSGPAERTPPTTWSAISVVVASMTPSSMPLPASISRARPPVPVAWKTSGSWVARRASATRVTQGVVTPNMVRPMAGLVGGGGAGARPWR